MDVNNTSSLHGAVIVFKTPKRGFDWNGALTAHKRTYCLIENSGKGFIIHWPDGTRWNMVGLEVVEGIIKQGILIT